MLRPMGMNSHNSSLPAVNKSVELRHKTRVQNWHDELVGNVRASVDCHKTQMFPHIAANPKAKLAAAEREMQIQKENRMIVEKLTAISESKRPSTARLQYTTKPGVRLTPEGVPMLDTRKERFVGIEAHNARTRREALNDVRSQNLRMLHRLQEVQGVYSSQELRRSAAEQEKYLGMLRHIAPPSRGHARSRLHSRGSNQSFLSRSVRSDSAALPMPPPPRRSRADSI